MGTYTLTEEDPTGYESVTATIPSGITGVVIDANTIQFEMISGSEVGQFTFVDTRSSGTATPTSTPGQTLTVTPTATETPEVTPTTTPSTGVVDGHVFVDKNANGLYDDGEGVGGATVELSRMYSGFLETRQSNEGGYFIFAVVAPSNDYKLRVSVLPQDYELVDPASWVFPLDAGETRTIDFQVRRKVSYDVFFPIMLRLQ